MNHSTLFKVYQNKLDWINRSKKLADPKEWLHTKEAVFSMYQDLRYFTEDGIPDNKYHIFYDKELVKNVPAYKIDNSEFPATGILKYRDGEYIIYDDEYGMQSFIVINNRAITVDSIGGSTDWYYELDEIIDNIYD